MNEAHHVDFQSAQFQVVGFLIPFVASAGSLISGYVSDTIFQGRRAPVAAGLYFLETAIILLAAQFHTANAAVVFFVLISFTANATHSIPGDGRRDGHRRRENGGLCQRRDRFLPIFWRQPGRLVSRTSPR